MCGIAGIVEPIKTDGLVARWNSASERLSNRGPDNASYIIRELGSLRCLLGHRRLQIVDITSKSDQPMSMGDLDMVFNGEVYNFRPLRRLLSDSGLGLHSEGDAEVVLASYWQKGEGCFRDFDGMWAVAFLDRKSKKLVLSRDYFGEKPLYYYFDGEIFVFASDIIALQKMSGRELPLNQVYFHHFVRNGYAPPNCCVFEGVQRLEPGQILEFNLKSKEITLRDTNPIFKKGVAERSSRFSIEKFEELFITSLNDRLMADVPLGLMLSGGIDSSYVAAVAKQELACRLDCYTVRYGHGSDEETSRAAQVAETLGLPHTMIDVEQRQLESLLDDSVPSMDEPISDVAFPLLLRLIGAVPSKIRVLLNGDGADELFLSYVNYRKYLNRLDNNPTKVGYFAMEVSDVLKHLPENFRRVWRKALANIPMSSTQMLEGDLLLQHGGWQIKRILEDNPLGDPLSVLYKQAILNNLSDYLNTKSDRASMWNSREFRTPFLNKSLFQYVLDCNSSELPRGEKKILTKRLNDRLGKDLYFSKRGMFSRGELAFANINISEQWATKLPKWRSPQERYRILVLTKWLEFHQSEDCVTWQH
ncbi:MULTISPECIES: asparagine synthase (glutamine-hydrolyzing) [Kordiimonas]|jgi:asparagine synthase (glutamine-hydrolysing)|uniref:asparagine synthase (glutamine-hydrolyzing) n=1 Tax=Kordiimonas TaxID=288021 RepID=UPI00257B23AE|nr:asparagine synthase (glutamine-hydrolyzing) [Kordiimonas sp. UBA4487]